MNQAALTSPLAAAQAAAGGQGGAGTAPTAPGAAAAAAVDVAAVTSGVATQYWMELIPIPAASPRLWLFVNNAWKRLDNPSPSILDAVQRSFLGSGSNVRVWHDNGAIVGLVVEGS
jgi:hypothetical protein